MNSANLGIRIWRKKCLITRSDLDNSRFDSCLNFEFLMKIFTLKAQQTFFQDRTQQSLLLPPCIKGLEDIIRNIFILMQMSGRRHYQKQFFSNILWTPCSRGCSTNSLEIHGLINSVRHDLLKYLHQTFIPNP